MRRLMLLAVLTSSAMTGRLVADAYELARVRVAEVGR